MARPSYLARRGGGRYYLQIRLGKQPAKNFGLALLRVSLRTSDFDEARRRLVDNLGWVQELIEAPDLESFGAMLDSRLHAYVKRRHARRRAPPGRALRLRARTQTLPHPRTRAGLSLSNAIPENVQSLDRFRQPK